jgi:hypothetical protein
MHVGSLQWIRVSSMVLMSVVAAGSAAAQTASTFGGEAAAVTGTVAGVPVSLAGTGAVDPSGDARYNSLVCYPGGTGCYVAIADQSAGAVSAQVLNAATIARGHQSRANASLGQLNLLVQGVSIQAAFVGSESHAVCPPPDNNPERAGSSLISELVIAGVPISVSGLRGQTFSVPSPLGSMITIVLNEQTITSDGITVSAMHIKAPGILGLVAGTDLAVAKSYSKMKCGTIECKIGRKVTGGGYVYPKTGGKGTFGLAARMDVGGLANDWGNFVFVNHETDDKLKAISQTTIIAGNTATIEGDGYVNGETTLVHFVLTVIDNGEPGRQDMFTLEASDYRFDVMEQFLPGGNIQIHKPHPSCPDDGNGGPE